MSLDDFPRIPLTFGASPVHRLERPSEQLGGEGYASPADASVPPLGVHCFARWAYEVEEQERELGVFFDTIVVCSVTGSTQAGMIAGFADGQERERRVLGIDASATVQQTWD